MEVGATGQAVTARVMATAWSKKCVVLRRGRPGRWPAWVASDDGQMANGRGGGGGGGNHDADGVPLFFSKRSKGG